MNYLISTVAELTGIPRNTLLAWERRYKLVEPQRHDNGYRSYSETDVATILRLKSALATGLRVSEAVELLKSARAEQHHAAKGEADSGGVVDFAEARQGLLVALTEYRRADAEAILARLFHVPFKVRLREVFFPVLTRIGELWAEGTVSIAQEHYASAVLRAHLAALFVMVGSGSVSAPHAVTTTFPGDNHEIAALALAIQLSITGFRVSYLGPNLPVSELIQFTQKFKPDLVCVSCILMPSADEFTAYLGELAALRGVRWVVGGAVPHVDAYPGIEIRHEWAEFHP